MRKSLFWAASTAIACASLAAVDLFAQQQPPVRSGPPSAPPSGVAVVDITYLLDHYPKLKLMNDQFKRAVEDKEVVLKKERDGIAKKVELLKTLKAGSPDYKKKEEEIAQADSDWKIKVQRQRADFAEQESQNYLLAYRDIEKMVRAYADQHGISLVLRFNGAPVDPNNRDAVQAEVFKMVAYYHKDIDITGFILQEINKTAAAAGGVARPPASPANPVKQR